MILPPEPQSYNGNPYIYFLLGRWSSRAWPVLGPQMMQEFEKMHGKEGSGL